MIKNSRIISHYHLHKDQPEKLQFEIYSLNDYLAKNVGHTHQPHVHSFYQMIWFMKGIGQHFVDFNAFEVSPNSIFFIAKNQIHFFDDNANYEGLIIHFNESFLGGSENDVDLLLKNIFNDFESDPFFNISKSDVGNLENLIAQLQQEIKTPENFAHKDYLKHLLKLFFISIERLGKRNNSKQLSIKSNSHIVFLKFRQLIESNFKHKHTVAEYASLLSISSKTLANYTKDIAFKSPLNLINDRVILEAKRLLCHSSLNVNEIGFQLGFADASYFVKFFKKQVNKSPTDFRKIVS
ncbi:AraC family transcriptional regulator [Pedobacter fastidiosus]|uniref:Helix-turn-helix domain-containing protein n=1 Tax=Pedobacter fastidiosus TaxID=2765361 RepID=A0ABR7KY03_9SPHI|nr:AraC family transcriptional regulator [Pedobacter fastidiosus]MBC6112900.1 helix-turn-helix domain-containing protein [Pedobacter fastidiosus]